MDYGDECQLHRCDQTPRPVAPHSLARRQTVSNATGYLLVGFYQSKPGDGQAFESLLLKDVKPFLDSPVANGTLLAYSLDTEDIHSSAPGGYNIALLFPDGAAKDKFYEELSAAQKSDPAVGADVRSRGSGRGSP